MSRKIIPLLLGLVCLASCGKKDKGQPAPEPAPAQPIQPTPGGSQPQPKTTGPSSGNTSPGMSDEQVKAKTADLMVLAKDYTKLNFPGNCLTLIKELKKEKQATTAVAELVKMLKDDYLPNRLRAMDLLKLIGPQAGAAVPPLVEKLRDPEPTQREGAVKTLGWIGSRLDGEMSPAAQEIAKALAARLPDVNDRTEKIYILRVFMKIGPPAAAAIPLIEKALADPDPVVQMSAKSALDALRPAK